MGADVSFYWESSAEVGRAAEGCFQCKLETESVELATVEPPASHHVFSVQNKMKLSSKLGYQIFVICKCLILPKKAAVSCKQLSSCEDLSERAWPARNQVPRPAFSKFPSQSGSLGEAWPSNHLLKGTSHVSGRKGLLIPLCFKLFRQKCVSF